MFATFTNGTEMLAFYKCSIIASQTLQYYLNIIDIWSINWKIKKIEQVSHNAIHITEITHTLIVPLKYSCFHIFNTKYNEIILYKKIFRSLI